VGCELDADYVAAAKARLEKHKLTTPVEGT
jgi:hypothetical protein